MRASDASSKAVPPKIDFGEGDGFTPNVDRCGHLYMHHCAKSERLIQNGLDVGCRKLHELSIGNKRTSFSMELSVELFKLQSVSFSVAEYFLNFCACKSSEFFLALELISID